MQWEHRLVDGSVTRLDGKFCSNIHEHSYEYLYYRRAAFWAQTPILCFGILLLYLQVREPEFILSAPKSSTMVKLKRVDFGGPLSLVLALGSLLIAMSYKTKSRLDWSDLHVLAFLITRCGLR